MLNWINDNWFKLVITAFLVVVSIFLVQTLKHGFKIDNYISGYLNNSISGYIDNY